MGRQLINKYISDSVSANATEIWTQSDIPAGETWHLDRFGGAALDGALVALQFRTAVGPDVWETVRVVAAPGQGEFEVNRDLIGPVSKLRVVRREKSGSAQEIVAWLEGYKMI